MRNPEESNFCYYPFFQILVTAEGKYRPCSKHDDHILHNGKILTTANATLEDAWNSDYMKQMRNDFLNGVQFPGCVECWRLQKMGLKSMRFDSYQYHVPESQVMHPEKPMRVEINASNVCNLKCRICTPTASTKWIREGKDVYGWNEKTHINLKSENLEQVKRWAENLTEVCFFGGEPLLSEENLSLLDFLIEQGYAKKISLLFNTNGTVFNDAIADKLTRFGRVRFYFSIDDIGTRYEYERAGAKWSEVEANLKKVYALTKTPEWRNIEFKICCTVSSLNIFYFPEYFDYFNTHFPGLKIFWNLLYDTWELSVQILPPRVKEIITARVSGIRPSFEMTEPETKTISNLITYLNYHVEKPFSEFFRYVNRHDVYRKESFAATFPEYWETLREYKPADLEMGVQDAFDTMQQEMLQHIHAYEHLGYLETLREKYDFDVNKPDVDEAVLKRAVVGALAEISARMKKDPRFDVKLRQVEHLLDSPQFNLTGFLRDVWVFGPFRIYKPVCEMREAEVHDVLLRKYPAQMEYKYA